ncbi:CidA/LrgA family protein [Pigmentiphaga soli]|uniref:CidA/LrgA family protein n=1 Tax=Pigmentiphaga soli TaxID=1007095 RepID=A0ABP8H9K2_9BURK
MPRVGGQVLLLAALWWAADALSRWAHLPVPAGVLGLAILLALLFGGWLPVDGVRFGAQWMLTDMLLFFIPAAVATVRYGPMLRDSGLRLLAVIVVGNACVMAVTSIAVELLVRKGAPLRASRIRRILAGTRSATGD